MSGDAGWGFGPAQGAGDAGMVATAGWDVVLANLATSGGTSPILTAGDELVGAAGVGAAGAPVILRGGAADTGFAGGGVQLLGTIGDGAAAGGAIGATAGQGGLTGIGGSVTITTGAGGATSGNSGNMVFDTGAVTSGTTGTITIGGANASVVQLGRTTLAPTAPGPGTSSEQWGSGASASGDDSLAVGAGATADTTTIENQMTAVGRLANASNTSAAAFGVQANATGLNSTSLGSQSDATGARSTAVGVLSNASNESASAFGVQATASGDSSTSLGRSSLASAASTLAVGAASDATAARATALGTSAQALHVSALTLGEGATSTADNQFVVGSAGSPITTVFIGEGVTSTSPQALALNATGGSGTDVPAGSFAIAGGRSTGNAVAGTLLFQTGTPGGSSATLQALSTRLTITDVAVHLDTVNLGIGLANPGITGTVSGEDVVHLANATTVPTGTLTGGGALIYATSGRMRVLEADGTDFVISDVASGAGWTLVDATYQASGTTITITIPAGELEVDGHHLYVEVVYESGGASQTPQLKWDGTIFNDTSANNFNGGERAVITGWIFRTGATAQTLYAQTESYGASQVNVNATSTDAATLSGTVDILADWAVAGSNIVKSVKVWKVVL